MLRTINPSAFEPRVLEVLPTQLDAARGSRPATPKAMPARALRATIKNQNPAPGEVLREQLDELGMSANSLASALHVPANRITGILNEKRAITPDTALRLERFFGASAQFWLNLQLSFDLRKAELATGKDLDEIRPLKRAG